MNVNSPVAGLERIEVIILVGFVIFYVVLPLWAMREGILHVVARGSAGLLVCLILRSVLAAQGLPPQQAGFVGLVVAVPIYLLFPSRSRHIREAVRRRVIARDLKGKKFDSRRYHVDHRWPFSLGGSNTEDNLRLIPKAENLRKGKKKPRLKDWF